MNRHVWQILIIWIFHTDSALIFINAVLIMQGASRMHHELFVWISSLFGICNSLVAAAEGPRSSPRGVMNDRCGFSLWAALSGMKNDIIKVIPLPWILSEGLKNTSGVHDIVSLTAWLVFAWSLMGKPDRSQSCFFFFSLFFFKDNFPQECFIFYFSLSVSLSGF